MVRRGHWKGMSSVDCMSQMLKPLLFFRPEKLSRSLAKLQAYIHADFKLYKELQVISDETTI